MRYFPALKFLAVSLTCMGLFSFFQFNHKTLATTPAKPQSPKPSPAAAKSPLNPLPVVYSYLTPSSFQYDTWPDWMQTSAIQWDTPGIVMEETDKAYGFHHYGHIGNWNVQAFGPRAGIDTLQFINTDTLWQFNMKAGLQQAKYQNQVVACNNVGTLLRVTAPGKKAAHLFIGASAFTVFFTDKPPLVKDLEAHGIHQLTASGCQF